MYPKRIETAIRHEKEWLMDKAAKQGIYENFGQNEVRKLEDYYIDCSSYTDEMNASRDKLQAFNKWAMSYNG